MIKNKMLFPKIDEKIEMEMSLIINGFKELKSISKTDIATAIKMDRNIFYKKIRKPSEFKISQFLQMCYILEINPSDFFLRINDAISIKK